MKTERQTTPVTLPPETRLGIKLWERIEARNLRQLMYPQEGPCVSIYLSTTTWRDALPGFVEEIQGRLQRLVGTEVKEASLKPLRALPQVLAQIEKRGDLGRYKGVGVFRSQSTIGYVLLREPVEEQAVVADSFHLRPLIDWIQESHKYYVMTLTSERVQLYLGTPQVLESLTEYTPGPEHRVNRKGAVMTDKFFFTINERLRKSGELGHCPLILMGSPELVRAYRDVNSYSSVIDEPVGAHFALDNIESLRERILPLIRSWYSEKEATALSEFSKGRDHKRAVDQIEEIARASIKGRVKTLILAKGVHLWGLLSGGKVAMQDANESLRADDVLDDLAEQVVARGGQVISLDSRRMPTGSPIAAVLHW